MLGTGEVLYTADNRAALPVSGATSAAVPTFADSIESYPVLWEDLPACLLPNVLDSVPFSFKLPVDSALDPCGEFISVLA